MVVVCNLDLLDSLIIFLFAIVSINLFGFSYLINDNKVARTSLLAECIW